MMVMVIMKTSEEDGVERGPSTTPHGAAEEPLSTPSSSSLASKSTSLSYLNVRCRHVADIVARLRGKNTIIFVCWLVGWLGPENMRNIIFCAHS